MINNLLSLSSLVVPIQSFRVAQLPVLSKAWRTLSKSLRWGRNPTSALHSKLPFAGFRKLFPDLPRRFPHDRDPENQLDSRRPFFLGSSVVGPDTSKSDRGLERNHLFQIFASRRVEVSD